MHMTYLCSASSRVDILHSIAVQRKYKLLSNVTSSAIVDHRNSKCTIGSPTKLCRQAACDISTELIQTIIPVASYHLP